MKKLIMFFVLSFLVTAVLTAQSPWTYKQVSTGYIMDICFANNNTGIAVGGANNQTIFATTNGGANWILTSTVNSYSSAAYVSQNTFFAAGNILAKSTDGGFNWTAVLTGSIGTLYSVQFTSPDTGFVLSDNGNLFKTVNGGLNWIAYPTSISAPTDMHFANSLTGFICRNIGQPFMTTNGGLNWSVMNTGISAQLLRIHFINANTGFIGSDNNICKTTNAGVNWIITPLSSLNSFRGIYFKNQMTGYAGGPNTVYKTTNSGTNWFQLQMPMTDDFTAFSFPSNDTGYVSTVSGYVHKTITGGVSFININPGIVPENYSLMQNFPNPFNPVTNIQFQVASSKFIKLVVYDLFGREVKTLVNEYKQAGTYQVNFNAEGLSSGIYFYKMTAGDFSETKKLVLIK